MEKLSVVIITKNEEMNIERCLKSVVWADEIVVLDSDSTDRTVEICKKYNCRVEQTDWLGFGATKQRAVERASHNWVFSIDADEEVSAELKNQIQAILKSAEENRADGYRIKRRSWYLTDWIKYSGWNKDFPLRLFDKRKGAFNENLVHESIIVNGKTGRVQELLYHYAYPDIETYLRKMNQYAALAAEQKFASGKKSSVLGAVLHGCAAFIQMYIFKAGFLDGRLGFVLAINSAFGVYMKYLTLWKLNQKNKEK